MIPGSARVASTLEHIPASIPRKEALRNTLCLLQYVQGASLRYLQGRFGGQGSRILGT